MLKNKEERIMNTESHSKNSFSQCAHVFFILFSFFFSEAQASWISAPQADSLSRVYFRKLYLFEGRPQRAQITITTTGYCKLYINECKVGTAPFLPLRYTEDNKAAEFTFDATPYLQSDSNVVAVLYSPARTSTTTQTTTQITTQTTTQTKQIAITLWGTDHEGRPFAYETDASWLCREANSKFTADGLEIIDGREHDNPWKTATINDLALWNRATEDSSAGTVKYYAAPVAPRISHIDLRDADDILSNDIPASHPFYGFFRATLREARQGEKIRLGNVLYICNGTFDEQVFPEFGASFTNGISVEGRRQRITNLEAVSIAPNKSLHY
jgi:hypothetical protein